MAGSSRRIKWSTLVWLVMPVIAVAACGGGGASDDAGDDQAVSDSSVAADAPDPEAHDEGAGDEGAGDEGADGEGAGDEGADVSISAEEAIAAYEACMEAQGVDQAGVAEAPSPEALMEMSAAGATADVLPQDDAYRAAYSECWSALQTVDSGAWPPEDDELAHQVANMVACMNDRGYNFAETTPATPYTLSPAEGAEFDWDDPVINQDRLECEAEVGLPGS